MFRNFFALLIGLLAGFGVFSEGRQSETILQPDSAPGISVRNGPGVPPIVCPPECDGEGD